jgi:hypothetical protein
LALRTALGLGGLASLALIVAACGGDDATSEPAVATGSPTAAVTAAPAPVVTDAPAPEATEAPVPEVSEAPAATAGASTSGPGTATLAVGEESWSFDAVFCAFSPEEARNARVSFTASVIGEVDGTRVQLSVDIQDPDEEGRYEGDGVIQSVSINDIEDFEDPSIAYSSTSGFPGMPEWAIEIDGKDITAEPPFDDETTDEMEQTPGTLSIVCP